MRGQLLLLLLLRLWLLLLLLLLLVCHALSLLKDRDNKDSGWKTGHTTSFFFFGRGGEEQTRLNSPESIVTINGSNHSLPFKAYWTVCQSGTHCNQPLTNQPDRHKLTFKAC